MFSNIRVRMTLWYLLIFGLALLAFAFYIYTFISDDMRKRFDASLLRTARAMETEFKSSAKTSAEADEAIQTLTEGREIAVIFREKIPLSTDKTELSSAIEATGIRAKNNPGQDSIIETDPISNWRLVQVKFVIDAVNYEVFILEPLDKIEWEIGLVLRLILFGLPSALIVLGIGGYFLASKNLRPIVTISEQAQHIGASNLHQRIEVQNPTDELGRLATVFNELLGRLDGSFHLMKDFMAEASHELRTPISIIHGEADVSLANEQTIEQYQQSLEIIREQSKRITLIVSDMLALARADAGEVHLRVADLYLNDVMEDGFRFANYLALEKGVEMICDSGEDLPFRGDEELLKRMVVNLLENAVHYTSKGGLVTAQLLTENNLARIIVADTGSGIAPENQKKIFDRFYRVNNPNSRRNNGTGLGLPIIKLAAESHNGSVKLESEVGKGTTFTITMPLNLN